MNRKKLAIFAIVLIFFTQTFFIWAGETGQESVDLVILYINDTHGRLLPYDTENEKSVGGIARQSTLVKQIRDENRERVLVLHAGDIFSRGDVLTTYYGGEVNLKAMEIIGYDAFTPGNGEFYFGIENLLEQTAKVKFPALLANVFYRKNSELVFQPYIIKEIAGVKVAVLGLGFIRENHPSAWPLILKEPIAIAREYIPSLREKADLVVALTHIGLSQDKKLASAVPEIDIIIGGHSHNKLQTPLRIQRTEGKGETFIVQAGDYEKFLGRLDVKMQKSENRTQYKIAKVEGNLIPINEKIDEDEKINLILKKYSVELERVLCTWEKPLANPDSGESPMGNLVVNVLRVETDADVALLDRGAVQNGMKSGKITIKDILRIHPWRNKVLKFRLTGAQLKQIMSKHDILTAGCSFQKIEGEIQNLKINSSPVELNKSYTVVTGSYLISIVPTLREISFTETGYRVDTLLKSFLIRKRIEETKAGKLTE